MADVEISDDDVEVMEQAAESSDVEIDIINVAESSDHEVDILDDDVGGPRSSKYLHSYYIYICI